MSFWTFMSSTDKSQDKASKFTFEILAFCFAKLLSPVKELAFIVLTNGMSKITSPIQKIKAILSSHVWIIFVLHWIWLRGSFGLFEL